MERELLVWKNHLCNTCFHIQLLSRVKPIINISVNEEWFSMYKQHMLKQPDFQKIFGLVAFEGREGKPASFNVWQLGPPEVEELIFLKNVDLKWTLVLSSPQPETVAPTFTTVLFHIYSREEGLPLHTDLVSGPLHPGTAKAFRIFKKPSNEVAGEELAISC